MSLHTIDGKFLDTKKTKNDYVKALERNLPANTIKMMIRIVDEAIESAVSGHQGISWCSTGSLFGHSSSRPMYDVERLWERVISVTGEDEQCKKAMGSFLAWRVSHRAENWIVIYTPTGKKDPITMREINRSEFFITNK